MLENQTETPMTLTVTIPARPGCYPFSLTDLNLNDLGGMRGIWGRRRQYRPGTTIFTHVAPVQISERPKPMSKPKSPPHLAPATRRWWLAVHRDYTLEEHHTRLLTLAAEAFDRAVQARELIARDGLTVPTADGSVKAHPAVAIERDSRLAFSRLLRELDLDAGAPSEAPRPPALHSNRR